MQLNSKHQRGFNLVELMVGMVIGLILLSGVLYVFQGSAESSINHLRSTRFIQQMRDVMDRMVSDIRRSGYMGYHYYVNAGTISFDNPYTNSVTDVTTHGDSSCITYAYNYDDYNETNAVSVGAVSSWGGDYDDDNFEVFGFKRVEDDGVGVIRTRYGISGSDADCDEGSWQAVTDKEVVNITGLSFAINRTTVSEGGISYEVRRVDITMTGASVDDPNLTFELQQSVSLPNHKIL